MADGKKEVMNKLVCDQCGEPVRVATKGLWAGKWIHETGIFRCFGIVSRSGFATVNGSRTAPQESPAPEPVDVDALVNNMLWAWANTPGVSGQEAMLNVLRIVADALGQMGRLWPRKKTPEERVQVVDNEALGPNNNPLWLVTADGDTEAHFDKHLWARNDAERYRRGLIAELEEKEGQSK